MLKRFIERFIKRNKTEKTEEGELTPELKTERDEKYHEFWSCFDWYSLERFSDDYYDEVRNRTSYMWYRLKDGIDLKHAMKSYAEYAGFAREHEHRLHHLRSAGIVVVNTFDVPEDEQDELFAICHKCSVRLFIGIGDGIFEDCDTKERYKVTVGPGYPGSADDAATYADANLNRIKY